MFFERHCKIYNAIFAESRQSRPQGLPCFQHGRVVGGVISGIGKNPTS